MSLITKMRFTTLQKDKQIMEESITRLINEFAKEYNVKDICFDITTCQNITGFHIFTIKLDVTL